MKKILCVTLIAALTFTLITTPITAEPQEITVILNGEILEFDVPPQIIDNRTMVPMRAIFEALGARVEWTEVFQIIRAYTGDGSIIRIQIGNDGFYSNDEILVMTRFADPIIINFDVPPQIVDNRTLVPLRAVSETLGANVEWDGDTQTVIITKDVLDYQTITVSTAEEFVNAIGSNRTIYVNPGTYDFAQWTRWPLSPFGGFWGFHISGVSNLTIVGSPDGEVNFTSSLILEESEHINIQNINFIHLPGTFGGGYNIWRNNHVTIKNVTSNYAYVGGGSENIIFDSIKVTGNNRFSDSVVTIVFSNVIFRNSEFINNKNIDISLFDIMGAEVRIENSTISGNAYNPEWRNLPLNIGCAAVFRVTSSGDVIISNLIISGNVFRYKNSTTPCSNIEYKDTIFENNAFYLLEFTELGNPVG